MHLSGCTTKGTSVPFFYACDKYSMALEFTNIKTTSSLVVAIVGILGGVWAIDNHYASAADVDKVQRSLETQIRSIRQEQVEDEIFKLDMRRNSQAGKLSPEDSALYQRYIRRLTQTIDDQRKTDRLQSSKE